MFNQIIRNYFIRQYKAVEQSMCNPIVHQKSWLEYLIWRGTYTRFGKEHKFRSINTAESYRKQVPIRTYDDIKKWITEQRAGETDILWPGIIEWFAKSSGTTSDKSKFIPVSKEMLKYNHYQGGRDMLSIYCHAQPNTMIFNGKALSLGGSYSKVYKRGCEIITGDLSAVLMLNLPDWAEWQRVPKLRTALLDDWEIKFDIIARQVSTANVSSISGVPSWMQLLLHKVLKIREQENIKDVWPNLEVYFHGGIHFSPYRKGYEKICHDSSLHFMETYNASEGFFGVADGPGSEQLLLLCNHAVWYEFIPLSELHSPNPLVFDVSSVVEGIPYALVISTAGGLWRYLIGDVVKFTSVNPLRFIIVGRTSSYINIVGEELMVTNAAKAMEEASKQTDAQIKDFTAGPSNTTILGKTSHEWLIEFSKSPSDIATFALILDKTLCQLNSDYEAKRSSNLLLAAPVITVVPDGSFYRWLSERKKLGGQNKVPRLRNDREVIDQVLQIIQSGNNN